jgi:two-component system cell cycle sensor histidine kinase/response regulator CckA
VPSPRITALLAGLTEDEKRELLCELQKDASLPAAGSDSQVDASTSARAEINLPWLLDQLPSMVAYWGLDQRCRYANAAYKRWLGVHHAKMPNITLGELLGPIYDLNRPYIDGALRGEPQQFERTLPDPGGGPSRHSLAHYIPHIEGGVVQGFVALVTDVSELHRLREELRERVVEITSLVDLLPVGVSTLDAAGNVLSMNKALEAIRGRSLPAVQRGDGCARTFVFPDGRQVAPEELPCSVALSTQRPAGPTEIGFRRDDGSMTWVSVSAVPLVSRRIACIAVTRDITQERSLGRALERSNHRFATILDAMPVPLALNDERGNITYLNPAFTAQFGYTQQDIPSLGGWWPRAYPNVAYRQRVESDWAARLERAGREGRPFEPLELELTTKDGGTRIVIASAAALTGSFEGEHLVVLSDITEKARAEGFLRSVLNSAMDAIVTIDEQQRIVTFNTGAEQMFRSPAEAAIGGLLDRFIPEAVRQQHASYVRAFGAQASPARAMAAATTRSPMGRRRSVSGCRADGTLFPLEASISQVAIGERRYFTAICRDTTDLQRAESARLQLEAQLRQLQKLEAIGSFAGGIAHDFNNILTAIMALSESVLAEHAESEPLKEDLLAIIQAGKRGAELARQLLSLSRPASAEFRPIVLDSVVREVTKLLRAAIPRNIEIEERCASDLPPVLADAGQVHQVLLNLCGNSAHAMRQRPGRLSISLDSWRGAAIPGQPERTYVRMSVADTGHGIPKDVLPRIFDPFFTTKKGGEGSGLGLAVARAIVEAHAGFVTVSSEPEVETKFSVFWPTLAAPSRALATQPGTKPRAAHIVVVDDDAVVCRAAERSLQSQGYVVSTFTDPHTACAAVTAAPTEFDVVVTDLSMPGMTGLQLAKELQAVNQDLPIILCTGNPGLLTTETLLAAGIRELVLKPIGGRDLLDAVERARAATTAPQSA